MNAARPFWWWQPGQEGRRADLWRYLLWWRRSARSRQERQRIARRHCALFLISGGVR